MREKPEFNRGQAKTESKEEISPIHRSKECFKSAKNFAVARAYGWHKKYKSSI